MQQYIATICAEDRQFDTCDTPDDFDDFGDPE